MLQTSKNGEYTKIHISELYNIIDIYKKAFNNQTSGHKNCLCNECFNTDNSLVKNKYISSLETYIFKHFEKINIISDNYKQFCILYPNISWLIDHPIKFNGNTNDFEIKKQFSLIGYDNDNVIITYVKPQFNELNYNEILMDAIFDTYLVKNVKMKDSEGNISKNYKKFYNKSVICVIFTTDLSNPYYFNWVDTNKQNMFDKNIDIIQDIIKQSIISKYVIDNKMVYNFYKYWRKHCPEDITKPLDIINYIIQQFNIEKVNITIPNYIIENFNNIKFKIENCSDKKEQKIVLKDFDNREKFMSYLEQRLNDSINRYFKDNKQVEYSESESDTGFISDED
jgi:hypothetical protein